MSGTKTSIASILAFVAAPLFAATPDYFPLEVGNSWTYRSSGRTGTDVKTIEVQRTDTIGGRSWFLVDFLGRAVFLRATPEGTLVEWDAAANREKPWIAFAAPDRSSFPTEIDQCNKSARIESRAEKYKGPLGDFDTALKLAFEPSCADAGLTQALFLPYVGLAHFETTTIAGPLRYDLVYSKTGLTEVAAGLVSSRLSLDRHVYPARTAADLVARFSIRNTTDRPLVLTFPSAQRNDLAIRNAAGDTVYVWSADKLFAQVLGTETIAPGSERSWVITAPIGNLRSGKYVAEAWLTNDLQKSWTASVGFEIADVVTQ